MSGEFGTYSSDGYFHQHARVQAEDATAGHLEITRLWGAFLTEFAPIAHAISWAEECDSTQAEPIIETIQHLAALRHALQEIADYTRPFEDAMRLAVLAQTTT